MQSRVPGDNRRSGRTTKMIAAALSHCYPGGVSYVVLPRGMWEYVVPILKDMGSTRVNQAPRYADFGSNSRINFITIDNDLVDRRDLSLRGIREEHVFWDHEAIRQCYNHIIKRYHEYD